MTETNRGIDPFTAEERKALLDALIGHIYDDLDLEVGLIAAESLLDFFLQNIGPEIYGRGVQDARNLLKDHLESLNVDLDLLTT